MRGELKLRPRRREQSVFRSERPAPATSTCGCPCHASAAPATPGELSRLRNQLLRHEYEAWTTLTDLLDPGGLDPAVVDGFHRELSQQMLKLCWLYARSGALEERYGGSHPFLNDLENLARRFEDQDFGALDL